MARAKTAGLCVLSALLLLAAFPPLNVAPTVFVALIPWLFSLQGTSNKGAWKRGYLFGLVFGLGQLHWLGVLTEAWTHSAGLGLVPWLLAAPTMAIYFGVIGMAVRACWVRRLPWCIPLVWSGMEVFRSYIPVFAFPWGLVAQPLWRYPAIVQEARLGTIYLVGASVVLVNVAVLLLAQRRRDALPYGIAAALFVVVSLVLYRIGPETKPVLVMIGQPGVDNAFAQTESEQQIADAKTAVSIDRIIGRSLSLGAGVTVLPEGVARMDTLDSRLPFHLDPRAPVLFGSQRGAGPVYQSAIAYDGRFSYADKTRLVIFGEFVPGRNLIPFLSAFNLPTGDLSSGTHGTQAVRLGSYVVGPLICFEALFPDLAFKQTINHAQILAVMSDDDWFMGSYAPEELRAASVWRAIESGLPLMRSAELGYSLATDGHGRVLAEAPLGRADAMPVYLPVPKEPWTLWFEPAFPLFTLLVLVGTPWIGRERVRLSGDR